MNRTISIFIKLIILGVTLYFHYVNQINLLYNEQPNFYNSVLGIISILLFLDLAKSLLIWIYRRRKKGEGKYRDNVTSGIANISFLISIISIVVFFFSFWGIDPHTLFTSLSIVAAAIAIITKEFIYDIIVGITMSFSKDFDRNDYVKINEQKGRIVEVGLLKIKLLNDNDDIVFIPNKKVYEAEVINYTKRDIRAMSIDFQIDLNNFGSLMELESKLKKSIADYKKYIVPSSYHLKVENVMKDYLDLKFQYTIKDLDRELQKSIRRETNRQIISYITQNKHDK